MIKKIFPYVFLIFITILTFLFVYRNWGLNFNIPYFYRGDAQWNIVGIKGYIESGKFIENEKTGAPFGTNYFDYPSSEGLYNLSIRMLSFFIKDAVVVLNLYYLLTFVLTSLTTFFVLKYLKISSNLAFLSSLIVSFLYYHVGRGTSHINLGTYYIIPLVVVVLHWIFTNQLEIKNISKQFIGSKLFYSILILILLANNGIYFSFFTISFLAVAGIISSIEYKNIKNLIICFLLSMVIIFSILINISPNLIHRLKYGGNPNIASRSFNEAEYYGLKIIELFIPVTSFKNNYVRKFKERYDNLTWTKSEGYSYLGVIGSIGFILLMLNLFNKKSYDKRIDYLTYLSLWALCLSVTTGIGTMIGYLFSSQIRVYSRISVFIAIFSIFALCFVLDKYIKKLDKYKLLVNIAFSLIFIFVIFDQAKPKTIDFKATSKLFLSDKNFIERVEKTIKNGMVFQLPYKAFPETGPVNSLTDYDLFRPYIHSKNLSWSYGIIKGAPQDQWIKTISSLPTDEMVKTITIAGYNGIYIDTTGYASNSAHILENQLISILEEKPIKSEQNDLLFFDLNNYQKKLFSTFNKSKLSSTKNQILTLPITVWWDKDFYPEDSDGKDNWRWSKKQSTITLVNDNIDNKNIVIKFGVMSNYPESSILKISSKLFTNELKISSHKIDFEKIISLPKGQFQIRFDTNSKKVISTDPRDLYFRVFNFKAE